MEGVRGSGGSTDGKGSHSSPRYFRHFLDMDPDRLLHSEHSSDHGRQSFAFLEFPF